MSAAPHQSCWLVVVDTDQYAGNFERMLVAYMTGAIGECELGEEQADVARQELPKGFPEPIQFSDGRCDRPAALWETPKSLHPKPKHRYSSVMCAFEDRPTDEQLAILAMRARRYFGTPLHWKYPGEPVPKVLGVRLLRHEVVITTTPVIDL